MSRESTEFHQTLHGYSEGHRFLSGSIRLSVGIEQTMLVLSDLSGHGKVSGFDEYITAYPLDEIGCYALAKTWYANEMSRPGCVWTHTLLIPYATLASTRNLAGFTHLFVRPQNKEFTLFNEPISIQSPETCHSLRNEPSFMEASNIREIVLKLYRSASAPILVPVENPSEVDAAFFAIWAQQWPRLRRSFTFCTGAIAGRRLGKRWFDLQGIPSMRIDEVHRSIDDASIARIGHGLSPNTDQAWLLEALDDLEGPQHDGLREFLFEFGAEADGGRAAFAQLAQMFISLTVQDSIEDNEENLVRSLEAVFPGKEQGIKIKRRLLSGSLGENGYQSPAWRLGLVLRAKRGTFNVLSEDITTLAEDAWVENPDNVIQTLNQVLGTKRKPNPLMLSSIASALQPADLALYADKATPALLALISHRPTLLADPAFVQFESRNAILVEFVSNKNTKKKDLHLVLSRWIAEHDFVSIEKSALNNPQGVVLTLLNILTSSEEAIDSFNENHWYAILGAGYKVAMKWVRGNEKKIVSNKVPLRVVALVVLASPQGELPFDSAVSEVWAHLISDHRGLSSTPKTRKRVMLRMYQQAMQRNEEQGAWISTLAFPFIYQLPMQRKLSHSEWVELRDLVADSDWFWDWDWCRSLREGLIDRFVRFGWPTNYFAEMVRNDEIGHSILDARYYKSRHKKFIKELQK